jgi:hypothetical protein
MQFAHRSTVAAATLLFICATTAAWERSAHAQAYQGSSFDQVWDQVESDPYGSLPHDKVTVTSFYGFLVDHLLAASKRTLVDHSDLLPYFQKLLHPNGICLAGDWVITEANPYSGYFRQGSHGLIIVRASTALSNTERGQYRAFGFAGKIFPTLDADAVVKTANFFTIENLGGTLRDFFLDAENTNDIIQVNKTTTLLANAAVAAAVTNAFGKADPQADSSLIAIRQLYPISELGESDPNQVHTPMWMMITGSPEVPRVLATDFRDELRVANYPGGLRFDILVSDQGSRTGPKIWTRIGYIELSDDAVSASCDHRLHFMHPKFK